MTLLDYYECWLLTNNICMYAAAISHAVERNDDGKHCEHVSKHAVAMVKIGNEIVLIQYLDANERQPHLLDHMLYHWSPGELGGLQNIFGTSFIPTLLLIGSLYCPITPRPTLVITGLKANQWYCPRTLETDITNLALWHA